MSNNGKKLFNFLNRKWFFDKVYNENITQSLLKFGYRTCYKTIDRGIIEILGPHGFSKIVLQESNYLYSFQTGHIFHYTLIILMGSTIFLSIQEVCLVINLNLLFTLEMASSLKKPGYDHLLKLIIIGDSSVGKTCILLRFSEDNFPVSHMPTIGKFL